MRSENELRMGCASLIRKLRADVGYSKNKMAETLGVSFRTYERYESGKVAPRVDEFIHYFDLFKIDALRYVLELLYPEVYDSGQDDIIALRRATSHYIAHVASDHTVRKLNYFVFGEHGSDIKTQSEGFLILEHLPKTMRLTVAALLDSLYDIACANGLLVDADHAMPRVETFRDGIEKARLSIRASRTSSNEGKQK